jgi:AcrR family transcriptional regulator
VAKVSEAHLEARKQSIVDAASRVFSRCGFRATTMAEVAKEAGISPGAIYRYFKCKDDLALGCFHESMQTVHHQWLEPIRPGPPPLEDFESLVRITFGMLRDPAQREETILAMEHSLNLARKGDEAGLMALRQEHEGAVDGIRRRVVAAQNAREISQDLDAGALAEALFSFYWGVRMARLVHPEADTDAQCEQLLTLLRLSGPRSRI